MWAAKAQLGISVQLSNAVICVMSYSMTQIYDNSFYERQTTTTDTQLLAVGHQLHHNTVQIDHLLSCEMVGFAGGGCCAMCSLCLQPTNTGTNQSTAHLCCFSLP